MTAVALPPVQDDLCPIPYPHLTPPARYERKQYLTGT
jgi:hypothetical protein